MIEFRPAQHTPGPFDIVEVWLDGKMVAQISPHGPDGITIRSYHVRDQRELTSTVSGFLEYLYCFRD